MSLKEKQQLRPPVLETETGTEREADHGDGDEAEGLEGSTAE